MKKTVDLGEMPKDMAERMPSPEKTDKAYFPTLYISGKRVEDMPAEGTATITYKLKRSTKDYSGDGNDSVDIEVQDISYDPVDATSLEIEEDMDMRDEPGEKAEVETEETEEEIPLKKPFKGFTLGKKAKIDSSKGAK